MGYPNYGNLLMQASCRRNFILEVVLTNAFGELANDKEAHFFLLILNLWIWMCF
jgi:hypothetical protein